MALGPRRGVVALALIAAFMVFVDGTIVNITLDQLALHLHASRSQLEWAVNAYTLSFAAVMLGAGALTDTLGGKRAFLAGLLGFTTASAVCATAGSMLVLDVARLFQGGGAALLLPSALVLATASAGDERSRHRAIGWWAAAGGLGMASGPLLGGGLVAVADWRAVFLVNVVIGVPALVWSARSMPAVPARPRQLDLAGMVSASALIGGLVFTLVEAPEHGWLAPDTALATILAVAGLAGFVLAERATPEPLLPTSVYAERRFVAAAVQGMLFNFAFYGLLFSLSLLLQQGRGLSAPETGLLFLPLTALIPVGNLCAASLAHRFGGVAVLGIGQTILALAFAAIAWSSTDDVLWPLVVALVPAGFSSGLLVPTMTAQSVAAVDTTSHGAASAAFNTARQVGGAVGVATFGPVLGTTDLRHGFVLCLVLATGATALALLLTGWSRDRGLRRRPPDPVSADRSQAGCSTSR